MSDPKLTIKNYKECAGREGKAWSCSLYVDGKRAALVRNDGNGGMSHFDWHPGDKKFWGGPICQRLAAWAKGHGPVTLDDGYVISNPDLDLLVSLVVDQFLVDRMVRRWCAGNKKIVYRTPDLPADEWKIIRWPNDARHRTALLVRYPDAEVANDRWWPSPI